MRRRPETVGPGGVRDRSKHAEMSDDDSETADPFEQAVALHEAGAFEEAIAIYRELLEA